jgi:pyruvate kinase
MAARAECVMLNKGPAVGAAIDLLDHLLARMDEHLFKKTPTLRALQSWAFQPPA